MSAAFNNTWTVSNHARKNGHNPRDIVLSGNRHDTSFPGVDHTTAHLAMSEDLNALAFEHRALNDVLTLPGASTVNFTSERPGTRACDAHSEATPSTSCCCAAFTAA